VRRGLLVILLGYCLAIISFVPTADARSGDSVTGQAQIISRGLTFVDLTFDAQSGPSGEQPSGTVESFGFPHVVTCLDVSGNQATIGLADGVLLFVEDNDGAAEDRLGAVTDFSGPVTVCPDPPALLASWPSTRLGFDPVTITNGDISVVDAPPFPTIKDQCKNGGWRNFPGFKNQGDCVSFVATGGKNPPSA
jgi:hypothetical protein